jgi:hypothetical protein
VTAETAMALPAVVLVLSFVLAGIGWMSQYVRCQHAAGDLARAVVRGESESDVRALAERLTPIGATYRIDQGERDWTVRVHWDSANGAPIVRLLPDIEVAATVPAAP